MSLLSRIAVEAARGFGVLTSTGSPTNVSASYLVVAGGAGGGSSGSWGGGGGGAGGLLTNTATLSTLTTYTVTVGGGGAAGSNAKGSNGVNSVLSGTGLTTVTSIGGGGGAGSSSSLSSGLSGGSGGGGQGIASSGGTGGTGTSGQGFDGGGGADGLSVYTAGGGGGGASAVGQTAQGLGNKAGGYGGAGTASSISGSSVTYAGGGGGGANANGGPGGAGGAGGGGAGGSGNTSTYSVAGTANTGGGGGAGGSGTYAVAAAGGSGIVIISYASATPRFVGGTLTTSGGNQIHTFTSSGTLSPITPITASYLVVAGGGGGGGTATFSGSSAGGGAGGYQTSSTTLYSGATYIVTVGAGGSGGAAGRNLGSQGSNSILSGTGLTTITSTGGGYGAYATNIATGVNGGNGGSGGGGGDGLTTGGSGGTGTSGQGNNGGAGRPETSPYQSGGGGGAGAAGTSATAGTPNGGIGSQSSISGTATYYAGGGGGGAEASLGTAGSGGSGGGGNGGTNAAGVAGTTNLGGGGGGAGGTGSFAGGAGGSGIVIISYAGSQAFNGGLVTSSGGNTIHTFTSTGALTPLTNNLNNSLRFRSSANAYLTRSPTLTGNQKTWTWSAWVKRGALSGTRQGLFVANPSGAVYWGLEFDASNALNVYDSNAGGTTALTTTQVFRDPSAWYHINIAMDTTQATAANRVKLYINGNQVTAFSVANYPTQNSNTQINTAGLTHYIGNWNPSVANLPFDGYMTDINFIDGQALEPYYFGNNDANGVWKPILYKGTYGTNGFYLTFGNTTSTTTLGYDSSPNGNNWTTNNISLTAGTTYDAMTDVPTNTSATVANYAVMNPLDKNTNITVSNANLTINSASTNVGIRGTFGVSSGKWYYEGVIVAKGGNDQIFGAALSTWDLSYVGSANGIGYGGSGAIFGAGVSGVATFTTGDIIGVAFDVDALTIRFYKNNVLVGAGNYSLPSAGTYFPAASVQNGTLALNFGQRPFSYTPPTGFVALNTYNLPTPTILQGNKYMDATLYTGNGSTQTITNAAGFKPDLVWVKSRSAATDHKLTDSVRGVQKGLISDTTGAETTDTNGLTAFNSNGWSLGTDTVYNNNAATYVGWQWQAGQGSSSSNTSGSITSTVSVNTTAGFSVVTYTGTGTAGTIGHGLGVAPAFTIFKNRTSGTPNWVNYHKSLGSTQAVYLNLTNAASADNVWNNTSPTSTVISINGSASANVNTNGNTYVAYCWAEIAGFSKFGSYTGNGSADGVFVYLGFRPKYFMIKITNGVNEWIVVDTSRAPYNVIGNYLLASSSGAEGTGFVLVDFLSNGFKMRNTYSGWNGSGETFIYAAFAENPFKNSNAR